MRTKNKYSGFSRKKEKQRFLTFRIVVVHCFYQEIIMEQDRITTDEIEQQTAEGTLADTDDTAAQAQKGILYETSLKQAEKNAKKEKRKGVFPL